jgi:glyoxylase-like metal-dependent hydrolase (beta-lactamase superfamily II)
VRLTANGKTLTQAINVVGPNIWAAIEDPTSAARSGANAGFVIGDDGVIVIDTFANPDAAGRLLAEIRNRTRVPIRWAIDTHHHLDHVAGNGVFAAAGAAVLAQRNVLDWIRSENLRAIEAGAAAAHDVVPPELRAMVEAFVPPSVVYDRGVDLRIGERVVRVRSFPGHTGGDSVVLIPDAHVVFTGDLLWRHNVPNLVDASTTAWMATLDEFIARYRGYTFVPGHGGAANVRDVVVLRDYLTTLRHVVSEARARRRPVVEFALPRLRQRFGRWDYFDDVAKENVLDMDAELAGTKRVPGAIR